MKRLRDVGVAALKSVSLDKTIHLNDLQIMSCGFLLPKKHQIVLHGPITRTETVEAEMGIPPHCAHNFLQCRKTGIIVDMALGQFLGVMTPFVFDNVEHYRATAPGTLLYITPTDESAIEDQMERDRAEYRSRMSPDVTPDRFAKRVIAAYKRNEPFCTNCKGVESRISCSKLRRCTKCLKAYYCGRDCQKLHWKEHRKVCQAIQNTFGK